METESVKSERSSKSHRSRSSGNRTRHSRNNHSKNKRSDMAPFQTSINLTADDSREEVIEVQILQQDENWGENTTAITGNTSDASISMEDVSNWQGGAETGMGFACQKYMERLLSVLLCLVAFFSPLAMALLPKLGFFASTFQNSELTQLAKVQLLACNAECKGLIVSLTARLLFLAIGLWALFFRKPIAILPRIYFFRSIVLLMVLISTFAYWLFYIVQITESTKAMVEGTESTNYKSLVAYAISFADTLLFIHYIAVVLLEIRHLNPIYYIKVTRSPDGESRSYSIGDLSIQRASVWILTKYYSEFPIYNPYLERIPLSKQQRKAISTSFKYYDVDGVNSGHQQTQSRVILAANARRRDSSHNERFYEEHEYDRRVKKRRARLVTAAEEAFTHIKRINNDQSSAIPLDAQEAAQSIFPSMARALQKYLRVTRQQPRIAIESILKNLAHCLKNDLSPRAFLEPYLIESPVLQNEKERRGIQSWSLICDELLSRPIFDNCVFQLIQNDITLSISIHKLPSLNITEKVVDPKCNKFVLRLNSETSV